MRRTLVSLLPFVLAVVPAIGDAGPEHSKGFLGVLVSQNAVDLAPAVSGALRSVSVRLGQTVRRGERLAALDDSSPRQELARALADLEGARAGLEQSEVQLSHAAEIHEQRERLPEIVSDLSLREAADNRKLAESGRRIAEARVRQHEARVAELRTKLDGLEIRAPFDGTVAARLREPGTIAGPGAPVLRLIGVGDLWVRFAVPVSRASELRVDAAVTIQGDSLDTPLAGTIRHIAAEVDSASGMIFCEAIVHPDGNSLAALPGRTVRVEIDPA